MKRPSSISRWVEEAEHVDPIFGWRYFHVGQCPIDQTIGLRGQAGSIWHQSLSQPAICIDTDISRKGVWCNNLPISQDAWNSITQRFKHKAPYADCQCGYYMVPKPRRDYAGLISVWCQGVGLTQIHRDGYRVEQIRLIAGFLPMVGIWPIWMSTFGHSGIPIREIDVQMAEQCFKRLEIPYAPPDKARFLLKALDIPTTDTELYGVIKC